MAAKLKSPATAVTFLILTAVFIALIAPRVLQVQSLKARSAELDKELVALKKKNDALERELTLLREDPVYLEKVARSQFRKAKEGEIVYKVVRPSQDTQPASASR